MYSFFIAGRVFPVFRAILQGVFLARTPAKPRKTAISDAPAWMNCAQKRAFSSILVLENAWKGYATGTEKARIADYLDLRTRIDGLRKMMRAAMREKDAGMVLQLNSAINATVDKAQRLEAVLGLHDRQKTVAERER
ncbi:hypothetical protein FJ976_24065 [Mesorhizobium sp. B1-1-9]|uniref:hypothetical protein n=1 Tax=Mesorhizobium sp. B1-1-9 TaxID=2589975 RepID=UPI00112A86F8|nr:hypothetical protein [Mesorhizobium sp. B1-1-9]TPN45313.1 hypothetical protein FJ976_24065 [Mesorhizobium sp. B1-1-9]